MLLKNRIAPYLQSLVFGVEDGMVSTLGALTGIAIGSGDPKIVLLAGIIVVSVESVSMMVGSFLSTRARQESLRREIQEELHEIQTDPAGERRELEEMYASRGFPPEERAIVIKHIMGNEELILEEMMHKELGIASGSFESPLRNGIVMFFAYIIGGIVPLSSYFLWPLDVALKVSLLITIVALFGLGTLSSFFSERPWWSLGATFFLVGGLAAAIGYAVGFLLHNQFVM